MESILNRNFISKETTHNINGKYGLIIEIIYVFSFIYARILPNYGLYPGSGSAGIVLIILAGVVLVNERRYATSRFYLSILFPILILVSMWLIVICLYPEFWQKKSFFFVTQLGFWVAETIVISQLIIRRGFIKRLLILMFLSVVFMLPFADYTNHNPSRLSLDTNNANGFLSNSNDFGAWAAFCATCLTMWAFSTRSTLSKVLLLITSIICFGLIALTVSRASIFIAFGVIALFLIMRILILGRVFSTLLIVAITIILVLVLINYSGEDTLISNYNSRLSEDTGRDLLWSIAFPLVLNNPFGIGRLDIFDPLHRRLIGPHNVFLYFGLIAGWIPIVLMFIYYIVAIAKMSKRTLYEGFLWVPGILLFAILEHNQSNGNVFELWSIVTFAICIAPPKVASKYNK